jgi:hypothetical protein
MLLLELSVLLVFACAYITKALVFDIEGGPIGLWSTPDEVVKWQTADDAFERPVNFFDRVRYIFGVYKIEKNMWFVNPLRMAVFECSFCLSFWISVVLTVPALLVFGYPLWLAPLMVFAVAGAAQKVM